jgi:hypothetical protein
MAYTPAELEGADLVQLLTLTVDGRVYRFASVDVDVSDGSQTLSYREGLAVDSYVDAIAAPGESLEEPSASAEVTFTDDTAEGWSVLAAGADQADAVAELALWLPGTEYSTRRVLMSGPVEVAEYGALREPLTLTLTERPWTPSPVRIPSDTAVVNSDTWPRSSSSGVVIGDSVDGLYYPEVIGAPGNSRPRDTSGTYAAVPALLVEIANGGDNSSIDAVLLLGRGALECVGVSNSVTIRNRSLTSGTTSYTGTPVLSADDLGQPVTVMTVAGTDLVINTGDELWASFNLPGASGLPADDGSVLRQAGDVIGYLLSSSGARVDYLGLDAFKAAVSGYAFDFYINDPVDPLDVCLDDLLPLLPVSLKVGPRGLTLVPWRYDATGADAIAHLDLDRGERYQRVSSVRRSAASDLVNHRSIRYAPHGAEDTYLGRLTYLATKRYSDSERERHPYAVASATRYGDRESDPLDVDVVVSTATAAAILGWMVRWHSQPSERLTIQGPQSWQAFEAGDVVTVSQAEIGWSERVCIIEAVTRGPGDTDLSLVTVPDWIRDI